MDKLPKVTVGFINCNRLHYLQSCIDSFTQCTLDYPNKEFIVIDNASVEEGTADYLDDLEYIGYKVVRQPSRDPANEFAIALNKVCELATGEYIILLQADMQFVLKGGWLGEYVKLAQSNDRVGCITLDAQRNVTNLSHRYGNVLRTVDSDYKFIFDLDRPAIMGAGDVFYSKKVLDMVLPWNVNNANHEGGQDSETAMLNKVKDILATHPSPLHCAVPVIPPSIAIYTDPRGTNARVRGNRRYGVYKPAASSQHYYHQIPNAEAKELWGDRVTPVGIEDIARPNGWEKMLDVTGNWLKNPIKPELAQPGDWVELNDDKWENDFVAALDKGERLAANVDKKLRQMERQVHYVDVGDLKPKEALQFVQDVKTIMDCDPEYLKEWLDGE